MYAKLCYAKMSTKVDTKLFISQQKQNGNHGNHIVHNRKKAFLPRR